MKRILFLTNGHGEDLVAAEISRQLEKDFAVSTLSLVEKTSPSGGFSFRNLKFLFRDISAGLIGNTFKNFRLLKDLRDKVDLTIAVGDIVPIIGALLVKAPFIFVGVNKSDYYQSFGSRYTPWEKWLLKKYAQNIYVRDHLTKENLNKEGIPAEYVGNPLMDCFEHNQPEIRNSQFETIGFLPGTREDAKLNLEDFEKVVEELLALKKPDTYFKFMIATTLPDIPEYMERKTFGEVLAGSDLIVGLSGTGNEQAAGCGLPVVSFYGRGSQYNASFALAQKQLLGGSLKLIKARDHRTIAAAVWNLINSPDMMSEMGRTGQERMGEGGAAQIISAKIKILCSKINT